jgi:4-amino-4-deoxy-L-arabinose transferase-like glycosyltransferase
MKMNFRAAWLISLLIKIILGTWLPFSADEAYYWVWGHQPQWSYFDHPAMVGWLFWLGSHLDFGGQSSRWPAILLAHLALLVWYQILKPYLSEQKLIYWLMFVLLSPLWGWGSIVITPDAPLMFFWSLAIWFFLRALNSRSLSDYFLLGAALGLGFCTKYHIVLFVPAALLWVIMRKQWAQIRWSYLLLTVASGLIFCFPVLYWNYQNEFASFAFQLHHGLGAAPEFKWGWPLEYLLGQFFLIFPTVVFYAYRKGPAEDRTLSALRYFAQFPIAFFFLTSFKAHVEANWPIEAYPALLSIGFIYMPARVMKITGAIWLTAFLIVMSQIAYPWIPINPEKLKTHEFVQFDSLVPLVATHQPAFARSYQMAAMLTYKSGIYAPKLLGLNRRDFYDFDSRSKPSVERFYLFAEPDDVLPDWAVAEGFQITRQEQITPWFRILEVRKNAQDTHH